MLLLTAPPIVARRIQGEWGDEDEVRKVTPTGCAGRPGGAATAQVPGASQEQVLGEWSPHR